MKVTRKNTHGKKTKQIKLSRNVPQKALTLILKKNSGRNNSGKITVRHQGGRHKRYLRVIDFRRDKYDIKGRVIAIEYDPNRSSNIALIEYEDKEKRYILQPADLKIGDTVTSGTKGSMKVGNAMSLRNVPLGVEIHNIELYPKTGAQIVKSAGTSAVVIAKDDKYADVKLPSKEVRKILLESYATIGRVSNIEHKLEKLGKAGRSRHLGIRPTVRGVAQNPRSHPHGGGEGRSGEGMHAKTPWGKPARGKKTRHHSRSNALIVKRKG